MSTVQTGRHGKGRAVVRLLGTEARFSELSYAYPLKLLSPGAISPVSHLAVAYVLTYGGGLVSGDRIELSIDIGPDAFLLVLTQGSTKVFRTRPRTESIRASTSSISNTASLTTQHLDFIISRGSLLALLPDPVTCFQSATYSQSQIFKLENGASAIILDWFTSGRMSRGEEWVFNSYRSLNEVWIEGKRVVRDIMLLESSSGGNLDGKLPLPPRSLKDRLAPYSCYATIFIFGPLVLPTLAWLRSSYDQISQMQRAEPDSFIWSFSELENGAGAVVRAAGKETEEVKTWLKGSLLSLSEVIGKEAYSKAFV